MRSLLGENEGGTVHPIKSHPRAGRTLCGFMLKEVTEDLRWM